MASARYTLNIDKEDLASTSLGEPLPELKGRDKRANWLHYHRWHLIAAACFVGLAVWLVHDIVTRVLPDYTFALVTTTFVDDEVLSSMGDALADQLEDLNGDGRVVVDVEHYQINYDDDSLNQQLTPEAKMAAEMRISNDYSTSTSLIFITDSFHGMEDNVSIFAFLDEPYGYPEEDERTQYDRMAVRWGDSELLRSLPLEGTVYDPRVGADVPVQTFLSDFSVTQRTLYDDTDEELTHYFYSCVKFMRRVQGLPEE